MRGTNEWGGGGNLDAAVRITPLGLLNCANSDQNVQDQKREREREREEREAGC